MEIAVFGAFDRYNYGDLLFPLILQAYLPAAQTQANIAYYGLIEADHRDFGSVQARPFGLFFNACKNTDSKNVIVIAGGRVMGPNAALLYSFLNRDSLLNSVSSICRRLHLPDPADRIARSKLNITWGASPFCPEKPNRHTLLIYNAVGGNPRNVPALLKYTKQADYLSVRNPILYTRLKAVANQPEVILCPDSAAVMSRLWPKETLRKHMSEKAVDTLKKKKKGYIVFQAKKKTGRQFPRVARELTQLNAKTGLPLLLLPLGRAARHEDDVFLGQLAEKLTIPCRFAEVWHLHDIMGLIAHSNLFIGTSLHGNITAMSYSVPHLAIGTIAKLDQYLRYWDIEPNKKTGTVKPENLSRAALNALENTDRSALQKNADRLSGLAHDNLMRIKAIIRGYIEG